jgi:hypothetical protein
VKVLISIAVRALGVLILVGVLGFAWLLWTFNRPPFDLGLLAQLRPGMSPEDVRQVLGAPSSVASASWVYSRSMAWPMVHIRFDHDGRFKEAEYDY